MTGQIAQSGISPPRGRLLVGAGVLVFGWLCPLFVPLVLGSNLAAEWKTMLSGLLLLGIPELFTLVAVAVLGKSGFDYLKGILFRLLRRLAPPDRVSLGGYRLGLVMFLLPILFAWISVYIPHRIPGFDSHRIAFAVAGDLMFLTSLFVLGGNFWDKFRALFVHGARARFAEAAA
jgi:hypothetical protein